MDVGMSMDEVERAERRLERDRAKKQGEPHDKVEFNGRASIDSTGPLGHYANPVYPISGTLERVMELNWVLGNMAAEAGYKIGDVFEYQIIVKGK